MVLLSVHGISKRFDGLHAVKDASFEVARGEIVSLIGPNGAGKTTIFNLLSRSLDCSSGRIEFEGEDITHLAGHKLIRRGIARTFQKTTLFRELTIEESVRLSVHARQVQGFHFLRGKDSFPEVHREVQDILHRLELLDRAKEFVKNLSHGDQRLVEIAIGLGSSPTLLLLDEPLAGLGVAETQRMLALFQSLKGSLSMILIEHDIEAVLKVADRIIVLNFGEILAQGRPDEIRNDAKVKAAYLGGAEDA